MYAVNVADLTGVWEMPIQLMLTGVVSKRHVVNCEPGRIDGMSAVFECDEERAEAIVQVVRMHIKKHELRLYHSQSGHGGWKRV